MKKILLIGGVGHCHSVLDSVCSGGQYDQIGVVARDEENYKELKTDQVISDFLVGIDEDLPLLLSEGWQYAFVTLGSVGKPSGRIRIYENLQEKGFLIPVIVDRTATVSAFSETGAGTFVGKKAVVNAGSRIRECAIINTGAIVEHDCSVGAFSHVSSGAVICGNVQIGNNTHVGAGSVIRQGIVIGDNVLIGAGSVVVNDIPTGAKAYGNPCRVVSE